MRIIKEGIKPATTWRIECSKCGCVFEFDNRDVNSDQREGDWVCCPTCSQSIDCTYRIYWHNGVKPNGIEKR